ncbi:MAG: tetratricopeptide repeat protein [Planctomycetes bacterium]|nr:tetratricopeptide repeat protein [Planctomycetota bacterium]
MAALFILISMIIGYWVIAKHRKGSGELAKEVSSTPAPFKEEPIPDPASFPIPADFSPSRKKTAEEAVQLHTQALDAWFNAGDLENFQKLAIEALRRYQQADWISPATNHLHAEILKVRLASNDYQTVLRECRKWLERFPDSLAHLEILGKAEYLTGRYADAASHLEAYAAKRPQSLVTQRQLAEVYAAIGMKEKGLAAVDRSLAMIGFPGSGFWSHPEAETTLWKALKVTHRFYEYERLEKLASVLYERSKDKQEPDLLMALGVAKRFRGDLEGAEYFLRRFLKAEKPGSPNLEPVRLELSIALSKRGQFVEALQEITLLLEANPYSSKAYFQLGQCLVRLNQKAKAEAMHFLSRALAPSDREFRREEADRGAGRTAFALRARAKGFSLRGQFREGEEVLRDQKYRDDPSVQVFLTEYLFQHLRVQEGRRVLRELEAKLGAAHADVRGWSAETLRLEGEPGKAVSIWMDLCREPSRLPIWGLRLGRTLLEELGRPEEAARWFDAILQAGPDTTIRILRGRALFEAGDYERALNILETVPPQEDEWEEEAGAVWLARARVRLGKGRETAGRDLEALGERFKHLAAYHLARAELLEAGNQPADSFRQEASRIAALEKKFFDARARIASAGGSDAAPLLLDGARIRIDIGDRAGAIRLARLAAAAAPKSVTPWKILGDWLNRPEELFFQAEALRQAAALDPTSKPALKTEDLISKLLQKD